ncbi:MAG: MerR family transcriptional regulator [Nocardiopsaceae bacterium]|jgi:DNA-binding transcriptional MerR regulator|nr:MerR family transcriptional regulator [Nocardiopsaceae bacterium]
MNAQFAHAYLGIGEVLVELRNDFPDISVSKIRFLEAEGLISPARSPSGYRRFAPADVDQLKFILTAQRDQYLPLRVIKERLDDRATKAGSPARTEMVSRRELLEASGIDEDQLDELEVHGLVKRSGRLYGQDALDVASTVSMLASYGVEARHLRGARTAAERDVALIEQVVAPTLRQRSPQARDEAARTAGQIARLLIRLHGAMMEAGLDEAGLAAELAVLQDPEAPQPRNQVDAATAREALRRPGFKGASA